MAGFILRQGDSEPKIEELTISSQTLSAGDHVFQTAGATTFAAGTSSTICYNRQAIVQEDVTTADTVVKAIMVNSTQLWEVESANSSAGTDNGDAMVLTDKNTVNNSHTNSTSKEALVVQVRPVGAASSKRILVKFTSTVSGLTHDAS